MEVTVAVGVAPGSATDSQSSPVSCYPERSSECR